MPISYSTLDNQFRFRPAFHGAALRTQVYPEAASSNFRYGEAVILSGDSVANMATRPSAGAVSSSLSAGQLILGYALADATGTTGNPVPVLLAQDVEVLLRVYNATATNAELQDIALGDTAEPFRYNADSGNKNVFTVISDAPNGTAAINKFVITEKYSPDLTGTNATLVGEQAATATYGLVWAKVRDSLTVQGQ